MLMLSISTNKSVEAVKRKKDAIDKLFTIPKCSIEILKVSSHFALPWMFNSFLIITNKVLTAEQIQKCLYFGFCVRLKTIVDRLFEI